MQRNEKKSYFCAERLHRLFVILLRENKNSLITWQNVSVQIPCNPKNKYKHMKEESRSISGISFENFRIFKDKNDFDLAPITILTGANNSGKSSVIKGLKLLQSFWENKDGKNNLYFEEDRHLLGSFENILSYNSDKKEIVITYRLHKHILFENMYVENTFELDESNSMKNGKLKRSAIFQNKNLLYEVKKENDDVYYFLNKELIDAVFIPKLTDLHKDYKVYKEKLKKYIIHSVEKKEDGHIENFGDYEGEASYKDRVVGREHLNDDTSYAVPIINEKLCYFAGIDISDCEKCKTLDDLWGVLPCPYRYRLHTTERVRPEDIENRKPYSEYLPKYKIRDLIADIPINKYDVFEDELWERINYYYPEIITKKGLDKKLFKEIVSFCEESIDENINMYLSSFFGIDAEMPEKPLSLKTWKKLVQEHAPNGLDSFFNKSEKKELQRMSLRKCSEDDNKKWNIENIENFDFSTPQPDVSNDLFFLIMKYAKYLEANLFAEDEYQKKDIFQKTEKESLEYKIQKWIEDLSYTTIRTFSKDSYFIDAVRANAQRLYTNHSQGTSFNELLVKFMRVKQDFSEEETDFLAKWVSEFEIGDSIYFKSIMGVGAQIEIATKNGKTANLVDLGYGFTQSLSLLVHIVYAISSQKSKTIIIEEPETNLHPKLQSKLADLFIDANKKFGINFIIETHSEYLIRKLQYLTATKETTPEATIIHYIGNPDKKKREPNEEQIQTIHIKPNGQLSKPFGSGFTDESSKWIKEMFVYGDQN
jgi:predicted ATPase